MRIIYLLIFFFSFALAPQSGKANTGKHAIKNASFKNKIFSGEEKADCSIENSVKVSQQRLQHGIFPAVISSYKIFAVDNFTATTSFAADNLPARHFVCPKHHFW